MTYTTYNKALSLLHDCYPWKTDLGAELAESWARSVAEAVSLDEALAQLPAAMLGQLDVDLGGLGDALDFEHPEVWTISDVYHLIATVALYWYVYDLREYNEFAESHDFFQSVSYGEQIPYDRYASEDPWLVSSDEAPEWARDAVLESEEYAELLEDAGTFDTDRMEWV